MMRSPSRLIHPLAATVLGWPLAAFAGNDTVVGQLSLSPGIESISVISAFSGDDNGNNQGVLAYRGKGASAWKPGIPMTVDRRASLTLYGKGTIANTYVRQWRAIIFGLAPATEYEVRVSYQDPDGAAGSPATATIATRNDSAASSGTTYYVGPGGSDGNSGTSAASPFKTIQKAAGLVNPGDVVALLAGTYSEQVKVTRSGKPESPITIRSADPAKRAVIDGKKSNLYVFHLDGADNIRISNLELRNPSGAVVMMENGADNNIVEDCALAESGPGYWDAGVTVRSGSKGEIIQRNVITVSTKSSEEFGILLVDTGGGHVIRGNSISGPYKDCIGGGGNFSVNGGPFQHTFIYNNTIKGCWDDAIEAEGGGINVGIWGNKIFCESLMGMGIAPIIVGPTYVFRNVMIGCVEAAFKLGSSSYGFVYLYHNTIFAALSSADGPANFGSDSVVDNLVSRNNIFQVGKYAIEGGGGSQTSYDYDVLYTTDPGRFVKWNGTTHGSLSAFTKATGQEAHGLAVDCMLTDAPAGDVRLKPQSPCIDKGVALPGFNDGYVGAAPDPGAVEYGAPTADGGTPKLDATGDAPRGKTEAGGTQADLAYDGGPRGDRSAGDRAGGEGCSCRLWLDAAGGGSGSIAVVALTLVVLLRLQRRRAPSRRR